MSLGIVMLVHTALNRADRQLAIGLRAVALLLYMLMQQFLARDTVLSFNPSLMCQGSGSLNECVANGVLGGSFWPARWHQR